MGRAAKSCLRRGLAFHRQGSAFTVCCAPLPYVVQLSTQRRSVPGLPSNVHEHIQHLIARLGKPVRTALACWGCHATCSPFKVHFQFHPLSPHSVLSQIPSMAFGINIAWRREESAASQRAQPSTRWPNDVDNLTPMPGVCWADRGR